MPLFDVAGRVGGGSPSHMDGIALNLGIKIGFASGTPVNISLIIPFRLNIKCVYKPAFKLGMEVCPAASVTTVIGPMVTPSSV